MIALARVRTDDAAATAVSAASPSRSSASRSPSSDRRGPFRPRRLVSARARQAERLASYYFRSLDLLALLAVTLIAAWAAGGGQPLQATVAAIAPYPLAMALSAWLLRAMGLYRLALGESLAGHLARVAGAGLAGGALALILSGGAHPAWAWAGFATAGLMLLHLLAALTVRRWRAEGRLTPNIVIVGATRHAERLIADALGRRDLNVLGVFDDRLGRVPPAIGGVPVLGDLDALLSHRLIPSLDRIVVAVDPSAHKRVREITARLQALPNEISLVVDQDGQAGRDAALARLAESPLAPIGGPADPDRRAFAKRLQDLFIGGLALILLAPVMALIALAVKLDSPGPVFFRQRRHGFNNEEILVWKFRSMRHEAADARAERQVTADDDRVTRVGRFLRRTSLDELPQLINVVRGEMSLVGPRPHAVGMKTGETESARLVSEYAWRHRMKPGMTGWAAVNGSRGPLHTAADVRRRVQLDIDYIDRQSFWLDLWIMLITVPVLLGDRRAVR